MNHQLKLRNDPYVCILQWSKIIEIRLYDEKRRLIKIWDTIDFSNQDVESSEVITKLVWWLLIYSSFDKLIADFPIEYFWSRSNEELLNLLYSFYKKEDEINFWVLGLRLF